jgi:uncharacterized membrane protein
MIVFDLIDSKDVRPEGEKIMIIAQYFVEFIFYSFLGWIWESIYCSAKERKWADRGFLFGPICPIYGACVVAASIVFGSFSFLSSPDFPVWATFIICYVGSAIAEFSTSWVLEKRFHARWWDYSEVPLNIQGRVCVPVSIGFGLAGVVAVRFLIPSIEGFHAVVNPAVYEVLAIVFAGLIGADIALTEASLSTLLKEVEQMHEEFNIKAQAQYEKIASTPKLIEQKIIEEKELAELKREQFVKTYANKLTLNQKRILLGIQKFIPTRRTTDEETASSFIPLTVALRKKVFELRKGE